jgi:hypothetical protein
LVQARWDQGTATGKRSSLGPTKRSHGSRSMPRAATGDRTVANAVAGPSERGRPVHADTQLFKLGVGGGGQKVGEATYGTCEPCGVGLLYKIGFPPEWQQYCGFGTLALETIEARHPGLTWFTTLQYEWAQGFYERRRRDNPSQWTANEPCQHFRREQSWDRTGTADNRERAGQRAKAQEDRCGPPGTRTLNLRIKSPQLCH